MLLIFFFRLVQLTKEMEVMEHSSLGHEVKVL